MNEIKTTNSIDKSAFDGLAESLAGGAGVRRFVIAFDATSSMQPWWDLATTAVRDAVTQIKSRTAFRAAIKIVAFRDRDFDFEPLRISDMTDDEMYLMDFISSVVANGGGDIPESIDVALREAIKSDPNMVILIGDAPSKDYSPGYDEAKKLGQMSCPVHCLQVDDLPSTEHCFREIASLSGGKYFKLGAGVDMTDVLTVLLASDKKLMISYQPRSLEGRRMQEELS